MAVYDNGTASLSANGQVTGVGTQWTMPLTLIRVGATIVFKTEPVQIYTISEITSDTSMSVYNPNGETAPAGTGYAILAHDGISVQGLAQDVAETLRYYQSRETEVADAVDAFNNFDSADFESKVTQVNTQHGEVVSISAQVSADAAQVTTDKNAAASSAASASLDKDAAATSAQEAADYAASLDVSNLLRKDLNFSDLEDKVLARENLGVAGIVDVVNSVKSSKYATLLDAINDCIENGYNLYIDEPVSLTAPIRVTLGGKDLSIKSGPNGLISFTPQDNNTYYQILTFDGNGTETLVTDVDINGGKVRGVGRAIVGIASNYVKVHRESSRMKNISAGVNATGCKYHSCIGARYTNVFQQLASQDWSPGVYGYGCVPIGCDTVLVEGCTFGVEGEPLDRHAVYASSANDGSQQNDSVFVSKNKCVMRNYRSETPETEFEYCFKFIGTRYVNVSNNFLNGGFGGVLVTARKDQQMNRVFVSGNYFNTFSSGVSVSYQDADAQAPSATWSLSELSVSDNTFILYNATSGSNVGLSWRNTVNVYDSSNKYINAAAPSNYGLCVFYPRTDRIRSSIFISNGSFYDGFNNITREMAPTVTSIDITCRNAVSSQTPLNASGANNQSVYVRSVDGSAAWRTYVGSSIPGFSYYDSTLLKEIVNSGAGLWVDKVFNALSVGPLSSRPIGVPPSYRYWELDQNRYVTWTGSVWVLSSAGYSGIITSGTTEQINSVNKSLVWYGHTIYNITTKKPVFFNALANAWWYADGTAM